MKLKRLFIFIF